MSDFARYGIIALATTFVWYVLYERSGTRKLAHIPTVGPSGWFTSYFGAVRTLADYTAVVQSGYAKYKGGMFKIPLMNQWMVVVTGPELLKEYSRAKTTELSMDDAVSELLQTDYTMGTKELKPDEAYHIHVVQHALTKNIASKFHEIHDEIVKTFADLVKENTAPGKEWAEIPALSNMASVVCRVSNRYFFDEEICRNKDFADVSTNFTIQVFIAGTVIGVFPNFLKPVVARFLSPFEKAMSRAGKLLQPLIEERFANEEKYGRNYPDQPNDLITWLSDAAPDNLRTPRHIIHRVLVLHLASIHTSSNTLTHALFHLAASPEHLSTLRDEIKEVTSRLGWTKEALDNMLYVDAFMRESQRVNGLASVIMQRVVVKPDGMTFSNGVTIPKGTYVGLAERAIHSDDENYDEALQFKPSRWLDEDGATREPMTKVGVDCLTFGAGRHSCPGRWFASTELKAMFAHVVDQYDIKLEGDSTKRPENQWFGSNISPNMKAKILLRERQ